MKLENSYVLPARPEIVWAALNDPQVLSAALPGCKSLVMLDERRFESTIQVRVGPMAATFRGEAELADLGPPLGRAANASLCSPTLVSNPPSRGASVPWPPHFGVRSNWPISCRRSAT